MKQNPFYLQFSFKYLFKIWALLLSTQVFYGGHAWATTKVQRIKSVEGKKVLTQKLKSKLENFKKKNKGSIDLTQLKPILGNLIQDYRAFHYITDKELTDYKAKYEALESSQKKLNQSEIEKSLLTMFGTLLADVGKNPIQCLAAGQVCNQLTCCNGLTCAYEPTLSKQINNKCISSGKTCKTNDQCCSGECEQNLRTKRSSCSAVKRCYQPLKLDQSCASNPVCGEGECLPFNKDTALIGACHRDNLKCSKDTQCCSNNCERGQCKPNYLCKSCVLQGNKAIRGAKCCEGLIKNKENRCVPDVPPFMLPLIKNDSSKKQERVQWYTYVLDILAPVASAEGEEEATKLKNSNFQTCEINILNDYLLHLKAKKVFQIESAMVAFEYVSLGDGVEDVWKTSIGGSQKNLHSTVKDLAIKQQAERKIILGKVDEIDHRFKCNCYDYRGYENLDTKKQDYFKTRCEEGYLNHICQNRAYLTKLNPAEAQKIKNKCPEMYDEFLCHPTNQKNYKTMDLVSEADKAEFQTKCAAMSDRFKDLENDKNKNGDLVNEKINGDASSLKYKKLLADWSDAYQELFTLKTSSNLEIHQSFATLSNEFAAKEWNETETKEYPLYNYTIWETGDALGVSGGAVLGTPLNPGAIAIAGWLTPAVISNWVTAGIIGSSAAEVGGGFSFIGAINGAWSGEQPLTPSHVTRNEYECGDDNTCSDYRRVLLQPYNKICNSHSSAASCVQSFLVTKETDLNFQNDNGTFDQEGRKEDFESSSNYNGYYLIDPWVPLDMAKNQIIKDSRPYYGLLDQGFNRALPYLQGKGPGGEVQVSGYIYEPIIDVHAVGLYGPPLNSDYERSYILPEATKKKIKEGFKKYALEQRLFIAEDEAGLNTFAEYAYKHHYIFPKITYRNTISYPPPGLETYINMMAFGKGTLSSVGVEATSVMTNLAKNYLNDYIGTLIKFKNGLTISKAPTDVVEGLDIDLNNAKNKLKNIELFRGSLTSALAQSGQSKSKGVLSSKEGGIGNASLGLNSQQKGVLSGISNYRKVREGQVKDLKAFNDAHSDSKDGDSFAAAQAGLASAFYNPFKSGSSFSKSGLLASSGAGFLGSGTGRLNKNGKDEQAKSESADSQNKTDLVYGGSVYSLSNKKSGNNGFGDLSGDSMNGGSAGGASSEGENRDGISEEDHSSLAQAVDALKGEKGQYKESNGDDLFEKVTKAYIRNYERVLKKKKKIEGE